MVALWRAGAGVGSGSPQGSSGVRSSAAGCRLTGGSASVRWRVGVGPGPNHAPISGGGPAGDGLGPAVMSRECRVAHVGGGGVVIAVLPTTCLPCDLGHRTREQFGVPIPGTSSRCTGPSNVTRAPAHRCVFAGTGARPGGEARCPTRLPPRPSRPDEAGRPSDNGDTDTASCAHRENAHVGGSVTTSDDELLDRAVKVASDAGADLSGYTFAPVDGATQAAVWKGTSPMDASADVALRLTPKCPQTVSPGCRARHPGDCGRNGSIPPQAEMTAV